jgi:MFS transporter, SP family, galactose:H+ symporter
MKERCTGFLIFTVLVAAFGGFLFGYHTAIISGALIFLEPAFQLTIPQEGMVVSILLVGALIGALFAGSLADRIGRKQTMTLNTAVFVLGAAMIAFAQVYEMVLLGRFISGIGVGVVSVAGPLYLSEVSPPHLRGTFVSAYQLAIAIGILISYWVNYLFAEAADWRWMFAIGILPALIQMPALLFLPETPSWLFKKGMDDRAIATLQRLRKDKNWMKQLDAMKSSADPHKHGSWKTLFSPSLRFVVIIGIVLSCFQQITGINAVTYFAPKIFQTVGFSTSEGAIMASIWLSIINVLFTFSAVWLLDKLGRRILLLICCAGMICSLAVFIGASYFHSSQIGIISIISLMGYVAFFAIGLGPVTWVVLSEIFPLKIRGKAMTLALLVNWAFNYVVSLTFLDLMTALGSHGAFLIYAVISVIAFGFIYRFIPETKGKSLEEIEAALTQ